MKIYKTRWFDRWANQQGLGNCDGEEKEISDS
jgi:hypothetical protein